jgi:hypothetical protein
MSVSCECCVLSGRGLCDGMITRPLPNVARLNVVEKPRHYGGPGPAGAVKPYKTNYLL